MGMITLRGQLVWQTQAREAFQVRHKGVQGTSASAHAFNVMKPIQPLIMTAVEKLPRAIGSRLCSHNRSRKNSILSRWYVSPSDPIAQHTNKFIGNGSARVVETTHTLFLMIMHPHLDIMASWRIPFQLYLGLEANSNSCSIFWLGRICSLRVFRNCKRAKGHFFFSVLASISTR